MARTSCNSGLPEQVWICKSSRAKGPTEKTAEAPHLFLGMLVLYTKILEEVVGDLEGPHKQEILE